MSVLFCCGRFLAVGGHVWATMEGIAEVRESMDERFNVFCS